MMTNLFSSFDPTSILNWSLNWSSPLMSILLIPPIFWINPSRMSILWINISNILSKECKVLLGNYESQGKTLIFISLFSIILFSNCLGLFPYIFTSTGHMVFTLSLALPLWLSLMIYGWINNTIHMFSHLIPLGTPPILMPFMVCIETFSNIIRPGTLAIRLSANMIAGHLLMTLLGDLGTSLSIYMLNLLIIIQILLLMLEIAVSMIQSYVFMILSTLYSKEIN